MARTGFTTSNYLSTGATVTAYPLTMACWFRPTVLSGLQDLMNVHNSASATGRNAHDMYLSGTNLRMQSSNASAGSTVTGPATTLTTNTWWHACSTFTSATSRAGFVNGTAKATNATSITPSGINVTGIGVEMSSTKTAPFNGAIAEAAIWNITLSDTDVAALALGISPMLVHPEAIVGYWPLVGLFSPENNLYSNSTAMTITGSLSSFAHPRIFDPE